jgi:hypothetical protein
VVLFLAIILLFSGKTQTIWEIKVHFWKDITSALLWKNSDDLGD